MNILARIKNKLKFIFTTKRKLARVMTFADYGEQTRNGYKYHVLKTSRVTFVSPVNYIGEPQSNSFEIPLPDIYCAELVGGTIIGQSSVVVTDDGVILYDMLARREAYEANMTDNGLLMLGGTPKHVREYFIYNYLVQDSLEIPTAISLACNMSDNYYHFMLQVASRFYTLSLIDIDKRVPLILDENVLKKSQMKEVIDALNLDKRNIISIKQNQRIKVGKLYILSEPHVIVPNSSSTNERRTENFAFDPKALDYIVNTLFRQLPSSQNYFPKRIFLSRKDCSKRQCNEDALEKVFSEFGFQSVKTDNMTIAQQMSLFRQAEHVMGGSGAAFTNLLFCQEGAKATIFSTGRRNITCFSSLGKAKKVESLYISPEVQVDMHADYYEINPKLLFTHLNRIYG